MLSVRQTGSDSEGVDPISRVFVPLKHLERGYNESFIIETEMNFIKPWEPTSQPKVFYQSKLSNHFVLESSTEKLSSPPSPTICNKHDSSKFDLTIKENEVLYPTMATLPHINLVSFSCHFL